MLHPIIKKKNRKGLFWVLFWGLLSLLAFAFIKNIFVASAISLLIFIAIFTVVVIKDNLKRDIDKSGQV